MKGEELMSVEQEQQIIGGHGGICPVCDRLYPYMVRVVGELMCPRCVRAALDRAGSPQGGQDDA